MTQLQQIRQEIERQKGICKAQIKANPGQTFPFIMEMTGYDKLLTFLDTLSEEPDKSLEEAAYNYSFDSRPCIYGQVDVIDAFKAGAEWQKSQMLKDAYVESQIVEDGRIELGGDPLPCLNPIILLPYPQFKPGDKVRIVIIKED